MMRYCKSNDLQMVVVTHHCPSYDVLQNSHKSNDRFVSLYVSNLDYLLDSSYVHTWIAGHTHKNFDYITQGGTRLVSNQRGKPRDHVYDFSKDFVVKVEKKENILHQHQDMIINNYSNYITV